MRRSVAAVSAALVVAAAGYVTADVHDVVPGILTLQAPVAPRPAPTPSADGSGVALPTVGPVSLPLATPGPTAPEPAATALAATLRPLAADPALGRSVGVLVRDGLTGATLWTKDGDTPRVPASTAKLVTAFAVTSTLDPASTMDTEVVRGGPGELVLVAAGDTMLARGAGDPLRVEGRAGLGDLAAQVATALGADAARPVRLRLDLTYAAGPAQAPGWDPTDTAYGVVQGVHMVGLAGQRPVPGKPSPIDPPAQVGRAFVAALKAVGVTASLAPESTWHTAAPTGADVLGVVHSAPYADVLALALDESDNALTENLGRQASVAAGAGTGFAAVAGHQVDVLRTAGIDTRGMSLVDASGLTRKQKVPARVLADILVRGTDGSDPGLASVIADLPVAGLTGTLTDRFDGATTKGVAGVPRAKTGTLTGTSTLAGTTVTADGRLLDFVVLADAVPPSWAGTLAARAALDRFVAGLTRCGCR